MVSAPPVRSKALAETFGKLNDGQNCVGLLRKKQTRTSSHVKSAKCIAQFLSDSRVYTVFENRQKNEKNWML